MTPEPTVSTLPVYHAWGVVTGIVFAAALYLTARRAGVGPLDCVKIMLVAFLALYLGSRLFFELVEFPFMPGRMWVRVPPLLQRLHMPLGFTFLGGLAALGLLGGALGASPLVGPGPGRVLDVLVPPTALGFAVSKVGCLLAGCCYGRPWDSPLAVTIAHMHTRALESTVPVRLLEMGFSLVLAGLALWALLAPRPGLRLRDGSIFAAYLAAASLARFLFGFLRGGYEIAIGGLHAVQWGALVLAGAGAAALVALFVTRDRS
jgi:phosphatidylglycerol:prolipoprotein diacylglycerol transferase